jgi:biofilm protein TabA
MRKIAILTKPINDVVRLMIHPDGNGVFLFGYTNTEDCECAWDEFYFSEADAIDTRKTEYGVELSDWEEIPEPLPFCQQDWIAPVRIVGKETGAPEYGKFEKFVDGKWVRFDFSGKK